MTFAAAVLLREVREVGVTLTAEGDRVRFDGRLPEDLLARLREHKAEVVELLRREADETGETPPAAAYAALGKSELVASLTADDGRAWEWLLGNRRDLVEAIYAADQGDGATDPDAVERALRAGLSAWEAAHPAQSALVYVPSLDRELWIASDQKEAERLHLELALEGDPRPVIVAGDVVKLHGQPPGVIAATVSALGVLGGRVVHIGPAEENGTA